MTIKFIPRDDSSPEGKLADAELHFSGGPLDGLKIIGFGVWQRRDGNRYVMFPQRSFTEGGARQTVAILRPIADTAQADRLRNLILTYYTEHEAALTAPDTPMS